MPTKEKSTIQIFGMEAKHYLILFAFVMVCAYLGALPSTMTAAFAVCMALGGLLMFLGDRLPIIKDFFGGGSFLALFGSSAMVMFGLLPEATVECIDTFTSSPGGFLDWAITILIAGSLLGVDRASLRAAIVRYMPCVIACQIAAMIGVSAVSLVIGYDFREAIMFVALPVLGGGIGAGAVPMSQMVGEIWGTDSAGLLTQMTSSIALANAMAIIGGGLMNRLGKAKPSWTGNGKLIAKSNFEIKDDDHPPFDGQYKFLGIGLFTAVTLMCMGRIVNHFIPAIHAFAWMIIICCIIKIFGLFPKYIEESAYYFSQFFIKCITGALMVTLGASQVDMTAVVESLTPTRFLLVLTAVVFGCAAAMLAGKLVGFYPIESGITTGLCATDMGGSGDIAILGAAKRIELLPYSAISTRIGGAVILILSGFVARLLI